MIIPEPNQNSGPHSPSGLYEALLESHLPTRYPHQQHQNIYDKKILRKIIITFSMIFFLLIQILMTMLIVTHSRVAVNMNIINGGLQGIYNSVGLSPITDVYLSLSCIAPYTPYSLGYWPGTIDFCYDFGFLNNDYEFDCTTPFWAIKGQNYTKWRPFQVCVLRANAYYTNTNTCQPGFTLCYAGLCVNGSKCPVTDAEISSSPTTYSDGSSTQIGVGKYFNIRRQHNTLGIGTFSLNIGQNTSCLSTKEWPQQVNYPAIAEKASGCNLYGRYPNTSLIDTQNALSAFQDQPWSFVAASLPNFTDTLSNQSAYLSYSPRLELRNTSYCKILRLDDILSANAKLMPISNMTRNLSKAIAVLLGAAFLVGFLGLCAYCCSGEGKDAPAILVHGLFLVIGGLLIPAVILSIIENREIFQVMSSAESMTHCFVASGAQKVIEDFINATTTAADIETLWISAGIIAWCLLAINSFFVFIFMKKLRIF